MGTLAAALRWPLVCTDIYHSPDGGWEGSALIFRKGKQGREVSKITTDNEDTGQIYIRKNKCRFNNHCG